MPARHAHAAWKRRNPSPPWRRRLRPSPSRSGPDESAREPARGTCSRRRSRPASWPGSASNTTGSSSAPPSTASWARPTASLAHATCALDDHDAPDADCSCGFYAVADDTQLWRLGADEPELAVLDVELAGRVIEHDHGYRASHQRVDVRCASTACACGAASGPRRSRHRRFGGLVPVVPPVRAPARRARGGGRRRSRSRSSFSTDDPGAGLARHAPAVRARPDRRAGAHPARHRRRRARHRLGHPARVRPARDRRLAGHGARRCSPGSANVSASAAPKRSACNIAGVRSSRRSRSDATSCSPWS